MKNEGWTLSDLAGELMAQGIDINDVNVTEILRYLSCETPEVAARKIKEEKP